jgi:hypothetical protein
MEQMKIFAGGMKMQEVQSKTKHMKRSKNWSNRYARMVKHKQRSGN